MGRYSFAHIVCLFWHLDPMKTERYLKYAPTRDVVFVLGAGASYGDGVPLQRDILPMLLDGGMERLEQSAMGQQVKEFIEACFYVDAPAREFPKLGAVFGFLDYFISQRESLNARYDYEEIVLIRENLIKIIHYIVNERSDQQSPIYRRFWEAIQRHNRNISVITLNYDTLLEQAFKPLYPETGYIDYCVQLMNYEKHDALKEFHFWVNPREPVLAEPHENPVPFKIIKLHGSLNWKYCNCCNQALLTTWDRSIDLDSGNFVGYTQPEQKEYEYICPVDGTEFQTLILPPSYVKTLNNPVITRLFSEASREIRAARRIVFIGYSLSDGDVHVKALFKKHLHQDVEMVVINPKSSETVQHRYSALSQNVRFYGRTFEDLVQDEALMETLLI
jgi:NAD-dependent SIR2 family protein deacetylase